LSDPQTVSYPITSLLDKIDSKLDKIDSKLDTKADRADLQRVEKRVGAQDERITALETANESRRTSWALGLAGLAALAAVADPIVQAIIR
jgi:MYXO-CTERM domain-containing protein